MTSSIPLIPDGSLDTHINRSHNAQFFGKAKAFCKQNDDRRPVDIGDWLSAFGRFRSAAEKEIRRL